MISFAPLPCPSRSVPSIASRVLAVLLMMSITPACAVMLKAEKLTPTRSWSEIYSNMSIEQESLGNQNAPTRDAYDADIESVEGVSRSH